MAPRPYMPGLVEAPKQRQQIRRTPAAISRLAGVFQQRCLARLQKERTWNPNVFDFLFGSFEGLWLSFYKL